MSTSPHRATPWHVRGVDRLASTVITAGGLAVIFTLTGICAFLAWVVIPLFGDAVVDPPVTFKLARDEFAEPLFLDVDEYRNVGLALWPDGRLNSFCARSGRPLGSAEFLPAGPGLTVAARTLSGGYTALGFDDGTLRLGRIHFAHEYLPGTQAETLGLGTNRDAFTHTTTGVATWTPIGEIRHTRVTVDMQPDELRFEDHAAPIRLIDYRVRLDDGRPSAEVLAAVNADGELFLGQVSRKRNLLTGETRITPSWSALPLPTDTLPRFLLADDLGNQLYLGWPDGRLWRYDLRDPRAATIVERLYLTPGQVREGSTHEDDGISDLVFAVGTRSLVAGHTSGALSVWFCVAAQDADAPADRLRLVRGHRLGPQTAGITALAVSPRNRTLVSAGADGAWLLLQATTAQRLAEAQSATGAIVACRFAPKGDAVVTLDDAGTMSVWPVDNPHPEAGWSSLFGPVWYEGYDAPGHTWQSSSGSDDFEPKLGLVPLVFGTLKATFYSMIFAVPIAVLAALYTSQFLHPRTRNLIKPAIEMMASLPSVVLGFVAALVLAPVVEARLVGVLTMLVIVPAGIVLAGHLWQMLPAHTVAHLAGFPRLMCAVGVVLGGAALSLALGPSIEARAFGGDVMAWLNQSSGSGMALWVVLTFAAALPLALRARRSGLVPVILRRWVDQGTLSEGAAELISLLAVIAPAMAGAWLVARGMTALGFDLRGEVVGTYAQRNTLVVGFVMGFAVIPIIYTISEDALSAVPQHLRAGSLACGASPWQTSMRVVLPIAGSGIFSAIMIGLGRAVGETMIVVMAAGNTPIMDVSPFSGLRALSANIAVELPEAVKDSTLYRVLFLAGLVLFVLTFLVNTIAEIVRLRFRKRAVQL